MVNPGDQRLRDAYVRRLEDELDEAGDVWRLTLDKVDECHRVFKVLAVLSLVFALLAILSSLWYSMAGFLTLAVLSIGGTVTSDTDEAANGR